MKEYIKAIQEATEDDLLKLVDEIREARFTVVEKIDEMSEKELKKAVSGMIQDAARFEKALIKGLSK